MLLISPVAGVLSFRASAVPDIISPKTQVSLNERMAFPAREEVRAYSAADLTISPKLLKLHWLEQQIKSPEPIMNMAEVRMILETVERTLNIQSLAGGAIPASINPSSSYSQGSWRRDNAVMQLAMMATATTVNGENCAEAKAMLVNQLIASAMFDNRPDQRPRFTEILFADPASAYSRFHADVLNLPRNKAGIGKQGEMTDFREWGHNQLDGFGASAYSVFRAANKQLIDLRQLDSMLDSQNEHNKADSIFSVQLQFLHKIRFWEQKDLGPWEKVNGVGRACSVGICLAAFKEARKYFADRDWNFQGTCHVHPGVDLRAIINESISKGEEALKKRIPMDGRLAVESDEQAEDAALSFLFLFNPGLAPEQEAAILGTITSLIGPFGIRRMPDSADLFMGENHNLNDGIWGIDHPQHKAAQWTLFDPILAAHFYKKFTKSDGKDLHSLMLADKHMKRTLSQVTKRHHEVDYQKDSGRSRAFIPAGTLPEARFLVHSDKVQVRHEANLHKGFIHHLDITGRQGKLEHRWVPNENSPLQMAHAAFFIMIAEQMRAIDVFNRLNIFSDREAA